MTASITTKASIVALSVCIKLAWGLIRTGSRWATKIDNSALYVQAAYTLCRRIEALGLALEAWADRTGQRLGMLDAALDQIR
jgi:hypothetical protein